MRLEAADVVEPGRDVVFRLETQIQQVGRLQGQEQDGHQSDDHEQTHPHIILGTRHWLLLDTEHHDGQDEVQRQHRERVLRV